jgi:N-acetylmuramoyl-L-alanine amidase
MLCFINPGHDRQLDSGAVNPVTGIRECDEAFALGEMVQACLEEAGIAVRLRQDDDLAAVCEEANDRSADLFVSIHFNAFNGKVSGTETLVNTTPASLVLGHCIQQQVQAVLGLPNRGLKERPKLWVLRGTIMPAALVEVCFIDHMADMTRYQAKKRETAAAIARGIKDYMEQQAAAAV